MRKTNSERWIYAEEYILGQKDDKGELMHRHVRKRTDFLGFLVNISSVREIFQKYVVLEQAPLKYLLTYKLSQDHLELFFSAVRSKKRGRGGNNNPTVFQFKA